MSRYSNGRQIRITQGKGENIKIGFLRGDSVVFKEVFFEYWQASEIGGNIEIPKLGYWINNSHIAADMQIWNTPLLVSETDDWPEHSELPGGWVQALRRLKTILEIYVLQAGEKGITVWVDFASICKGREQNWERIDASSLFLLIFIGNITNKSNCVHFVKIFNTILN